MRTWWRVNKPLIVCNNRAGITTKSHKRKVSCSFMVQARATELYVIAHCVYLLQELLIGRSVITVIVDIESGYFFLRYNNSQNVAGIAITITITT